MIHRLLEALVHGPLHQHCLTSVEDVSRRRPMRRRHRRRTRLSLLLLVSRLRRLLLLLFSIVVHHTLPGIRRKLGEMQEVPTHSISIP